MHRCIYILEAHTSKVTLDPQAVYWRGKFHFFFLRKTTYRILQDTVRRKIGVGYIKHCKELGSTFPPTFPSERNKKSSSLLKLIAVKGNCIHRNFSSIASFLKILYQTSLLLHSSNKMVGGFKRRETINTVRIHQHPPVL